MYAAADGPGLRNAPCQASCPLPFYSTLHLASHGPIAPPPALTDQPINTFLRQLAELKEPYKTALARHPGLSFGATVTHISDAIRKLVAVATAEEASAPLYRAVRGVLPHGFFDADAAGLVSATDTAFMSTSRERTTPIRYMGENAENVLWCLQPRNESDSAFHSGADVAMLSQFAEEREVLFPPCTMLVVLPGGVREWECVERDEDGGERRFLSVACEPHFV